MKCLYLCWVIFIVCQATREAAASPLSAPSVSVSFATFGHFYWVPYPESHNVLCLCVMVYFALHWTIQALAWFVEQDTILWASPKNDKQKTGVRVRASLQRFTPDYTISFENDVKDSSQKYQTSIILQVDRFFDTEGHVVSANFVTALDDLWKQFKAKEAKKAQ